MPRSAAVTASRTTPEDDTLAKPDAATVAAPISAPGFAPPLTGYEFELNHEGNLGELCRQKQWAWAQLQSCNENNNFRRTQTTACVVAVNGHIIGPYRPESLWCYGTNIDITGLRVTMTVHEGDSGVSSGSGNDCKGGKDTNDGNVPVFRGATLKLRHQIIHAKPRHHPASSSSFMLPQPHVISSTPSLLQASCADRSSGPNRTGVIAGSASSTSSRYGRPRRQQTRPHSFATTTIPLHTGVATRPGYRPVESSAAADRIRQWGGQPDKGVFGNAWLVHMAVEPGHVKHEVDTKVMEEVARIAGCTLNARPGGGGRKMRGNEVPGTHSTTMDAAQTMRMVNEHMELLVKKEGTLSVLLSNHMTQKRMARQCPDLVAMWVMAQDNL